MKLSDYPNVRKAFKAIEADSGGDMKRRILNAEVPKKWLTRFNSAEYCLRRISKFRLCEIPLSVKDWKEIMAGSESNPLAHAFDCVVVPCNTEDVLILRSMGYSREYISNTRKVLSEFFDGELDMFVKEQAYGRPINEKKERKLWQKKKKKQKK